MHRYYIEYLNTNGMDRETIILADDPQQALHKFNMQFGMLEILDVIDITNPDQELQHSVVDEIYT
jgi:hypothetical protein